MKKNMEWLSRLNRDSKGIWGISHPIGSDRGAICVIETTPQSCEVLNIFVVSEAGYDTYKLEEDTGESKSLSEFFEVTASSAREFERGRVRVIIQDFHLGNKEFQSSLINQSRSIQESCVDLSVQFVFSGQWSYYEFCSNYQGIHGKTSSPAAEFKNFLYVPNISINELKSLLVAEQLISAQMSDIDNVACELLLESTSGDEFLIKTAIQYLKDNGLSLDQNVETIILELAAAPEVIEHVKQAVKMLNASSLDELNKLLRVHRLTRKNNRASTELLWIAGLVKFENLYGSNHLIQISGTIINRVLRNIAEEVGLAKCSPAENLCLESNVISTHVFCKVAEIENLFRSLAVSSWYEELGESWEDKLDKIKTPAYQKTENEELISLVLKCMGEAFPQLQKTAPADCAENATEKMLRGKRNHETVLESAKDWQRRQSEAHSIELASNNLMHFLTTEKLIDAITHRKVGLVGEDKIFTKKEFLVNTLEEYVSVRSAVAHNQPLMLETLISLDVLYKKIINWITVYSDK